MVAEVVKVLRGRTEDLISELSSKMNEAAAALIFERAAEIRDRIDQLKIYSLKQKIVTNDNGDRDVIAIAYEGSTAACSIFNIRSGKLVGKKQLTLGIEINNTKTEIYAAAVKFYYEGEFTEVPRTICLECLPDENELLIEWLNTKALKHCEFFVPQKGELKNLLTMCSKNAELQLKEIQLQKLKKEGNVPYLLAALKRDLGLPDYPHKIECFDISNLQGTDTVASMVVFEEGKPKKSEYRRFIIKDVDGPNDFLSMMEVLTRRYSRLKEENKPLPGLIMVDGGKGQLSSAVKILNSLGFEHYNIIGLAKRLEEVFFPGTPDALIIPKASSSLRLLQHLRDEAHRFAITFHRERRSKRTFTSELMEIEGIGKSTAEKLLSQLGSFIKVSQATENEIASVIGKAKAGLVIKYFINKKEQLK